MVFGRSSNKWSKISRISLKAHWRAWKWVNKASVRSRRDYLGEWISRLCGAAAACSRREWERFTSVALERERSYICICEDLHTSSSPQQLLNLSTRSQSEFATNPHVIHLHLTQRNTEKIILNKEDDFINYKIIGNKLELLLVIAYILKGAGIMFTLFCNKTRGNVKTRMRCLRRWFNKLESRAAFCVVYIPSWGCKSREIRCWELPGDTNTAGKKQLPWAKRAFSVQRKTIYIICRV